jgi:acyl-CoA synthetase (AMP-forming)/AMP-acid ligase II
MRLHGAWLAPRAADSVVLVKASGESVSFSALVAAVDELEGELRRLGVSTGDRVVVCDPDLLSFVAGVIALSRCGAVFVPRERLAGPERNKIILESAEPKATIHSLGQVEAHSPGAEKAPPEAAAFFYSSGSTGNPKGVMLTHANLLYVARELGLAMGMRAGQRELLISRPTHMDGWQRLSAAISAGSTVIDGSVLGLASLAEEIRHHSATSLYLPPPIAEAAQSLSVELPPCLLSIETGSSRFAPATFACLRAAAPSARIFHHYGLTECSRATLLEIRDSWSAGDCGRPLPGVSVEAREEGELWLRGPQLALGYWRNQRLSADRFQGGWFRTGDSGEITSSGALRFRGRLDDLVERWGAHFYPAEAEREILAVPGVERCAYLSLSGARTAAVLKLHGGFDPRDIERRCNSALPPALRPDFILFRDDLPLLPSGKTDRLALAKWAEGVLARNESK